MAKLELTGAYCYESLESGDLKIYACPLIPGDDSVEITIERHDVQRLMVAAIHALQKKETWR